MAAPGLSGEDFTIVSVEPAEAPDNLGGSNWYRYVIDQGANRICGYRQGSRQDITQSVEELVLRLNQRRLGTKWRADIGMPARGKPAAPK